MILLLLAAPDPARAQIGAVTIQKQLCDGSSCDLANQPASGVAPGAAVFYKIILSNPTGSSITLDVLDNLPPAFQPVGYACGPSVNAGTPVTASTAQAVVIPNVSVGPGATVECKIAGSFTSAVGSASNTAATAAPGSPAPVTTSNDLNNSVQLTGPQPYNLSIAKTVDLNAIDVSTGAKQVIFTITVTNTGNEDLYLGKLLSVEDRLRLMTSSVVLNATHVATTCAIVAAPSTTTTVSECLNPVPFVAASQPMLVNSPAPADFVRWRYLSGAPGLLKAHDQIVLTVKVDIDAVAGADCIIAANSDGLIDKAYIVLTLPSPVPNGPITTLNDSNAADNSSADVPVSVVTGATVVNPNCNAPFLPPSPVLKVTKTQITPAQPGGLPWGPGNPITYEIEVENITTNIMVSDLKLADWVVEGVETPPFTATIVSYTCPHPISGPNPGCPNPVTSPQQALTGNSDTKQMFGAVVLSPGTLYPTAKFRFRVVLAYSNPQCDSYPGINPKPIHNIGMVTGWTQASSGSLPVPVTQTVTGAVTTFMQPPPPCPLKVAKTLDTTSPPPVKFGSPIQYTVTYSNPDTTTGYTMGTLFDGMRLVRSPATNPTPYAVQLKVDYRYVCTPQGGVTGYPPNNPAGPGVDDVALVTETQLPQQGVRLIRNLAPVAFPPGSSLTCTVTATVQPPSPNDPYCSTGMLENSAVLDASNFYNPNTPWPTTSTPGMWASVQSPLPRCFNVRVNKEVPRPGWTWQGGPLKWTLTVTNNGLPIAGSEVQIADQFSTAVNPGETTSCTGTGCSAAWSQSPSTNNPSTLEIASLPTLGQVKTDFTATAPPGTRPGSRLCNDAKASVQTTDHWYWKDETITRSNACVTVIATGSLTISKRVINRTGAAVAGDFTVNVNCTNPNADYNGPVTSVILADGGSATVEHIPVGSSCSFAEAPPAIPPGTDRCQFPVWATTYSPASPVIRTGATRVTVTNILDCRPTGLVQIIKETALPPGMTLPFSTIDFTLNCTPFGPSRTLSVPVNGESEAIVVAAPGTCTAVERVPAAPAGCEWQVVERSPRGVAVTAGVVEALVVSNRLVCATGGVVIRKETLLPPVLFDVNCVPNGPSMTISVPANGEAPAFEVPPPGTCTITEQTPPAPPGCRWLTSQAPPGTLAVGGGPTTIVTVTNRLVCEGRLVIVKSTLVPTGMQMPASFLFNLSCGGASPVSVSAPANGSAPAVTVSAPALCTIVEQVPTAPAGCVWTASQAPPGSVAIPVGATVSVKVDNRMTCPGFGRLEIVKKTIFPPGVPQNLSVNFNVNCSVGGFSTSTGGPTNGTHTVHNIPAPSTCTIVEQPLSAPTGCTWVPTQTPPGPVPIAPGSTATVNVTNSLKCDGPGSLSIRKLLNLPAGVPPVASFQANVSCPGGFTTTVAVPANGSAPLISLPAPATCTVAEQLPPAPAGCSWAAPSYLPTASPAIATGVTAVVVMVNTLTCSPPGRLIINKKTVVPINKPVPANFMFSVNCTPGGPSTSMTVPANGQSTGLSVPAGSTCTITEQVPPPPFACTWTTTPLQPVTVAAGATIIVAASNTMACSPIGNLIIAKTTIGAAPAQIPFAINCSPNGPNIPAGMVPSNGQTVALAIPAPATCTIVEQVPPAPAGCSWNVTQSPVGPHAVAPGATTTVKFSNTLVCGAGLFIKKTTSAPINKPVPANFMFSVNCAPGGPSTTISVPANGQSTGLTVPAGSTCTVTEQVPPPPFACTWTTTLLQPVTVAAGATVTVAASNTMVCSPTGNLIIAKKTIGAAPAQIPFSVNCSPSGYSIPAAMVPSNGQTVAFTIPAPATCTIVERVPPAPAGCSWKVTQTPIGPHSVAPGVTTTVQFANELVCNAAGELIIKKTTAFGPLPASFAAVSFNVNCTPGGPSTTVSVPANGQASLGIPAAATCTIVEQPPPAPAGCAWVGTQTPPGNVAVAAGATVTVSFANQLVCAPPSRILVQKGTTGPPGVPLPASILFNVNCTPGGPTTTITAPANGFSPPLDVPGGSTCTVTEQVPPAPVGCTWSATQVPPGNAAVAAGATVVVTFINKLVCNVPGTLIVKKETFGSGLVVNFVSIPIDVDCGAGGPRASLTLPSNGQVSVGNIPGGKTCAVTEHLPATNRPNCRWVGTPVPSNPITVAGGTTTTMTITNRLVCSDVSATLIIRKVTAFGPTTPSFPAAIFNVNCTPGGPTTTVSVPPNGQSSLGGIVAPASCAIVEQPPPAPTGCTWVGTRVPSGNVALDGGATVTVTVTNNLDCTPPGRILVQKGTTGPPGVPLPASILFSLSCTPSGPNTTITAPANGFSSPVAVPAHAICTIVEQVPPAPAGCAWVTAQQPAGPMMVAPGATVVVTATNRLNCPAGGATLIVRKSTVFPPGATQFASVTVNVSCTPGGPNTTITVPANGQTAVTNIPVPATCVVTEQVPPSSVAGCGWSATKVPAGTNALASAGATGTASLTNSWVCNAASAGPGSTLLIRQLVLFNTDPNPRSPTVIRGGAAYAVSVACGAEPPATIELTAANDYQAIRGPFPAGTRCRIEQLPDPGAPNCSAPVSYPQGQTAVIGEVQVGRDVVYDRDKRVCT